MTNEEDRQEILNVYVRPTLAQFEAELDALRDECVPVQPEEGEGADHDALARIRMVLPAVEAMQAQVKALNGYDRRVRRNAKIDAYRKTAAGKAKRNRKAREKYAANKQDATGLPVNQYGVPDSIAKEVGKKTQKAARRKSRPAAVRKAEKDANTSARRLKRLEDNAKLTDAERALKRAEETKKRYEREARAKERQEAERSELEAQEKERLNQHYLSNPNFGKF